MLRQSLLAVAAVALSAGPAWAFAICPLGGGLAGQPLGGSIKITGTHYDEFGNATKVKCDTNAGDSIIVSTEGASPPGLALQLIALSPTCGALDAMVNSGWVGFGPSGTEVQVVRNGIPKLQCVFHGATEHPTPGNVGHWVAHTLRKFASAGNPTVEKGSLTLNTHDGKIFIGKIAIKYP